MFKRQPKPFPPSFFLGVAVLLFTVLFLMYNAGKNTETAKVKEMEQTNPDRAGLTPPEEFFLSREYPHFQWDVSAYDAVLKSAQQKEQDRNTFPGFTAPWAVEGPSNIGARINTIAVHPSNPNIIYIGYSSGGVWKTTNGGQSWTPIFDGQSYSAIGDIAIDPQSPNTIYVGTGDPNISGYPFIGDGLWKSTDAGATWTNIGLTHTRIISQIRIHPSNPDMIFVATMGLPFERNNDRGLYRTFDGGQSWEKVLFIGNETGIIDMEINPVNPNIIYAAAWDRIRNNSESVVSGNNARIWRSTNGGESWTMLDNGLPMDEKSRIGLSINPQEPNKLVAVYVGTDLYFDNIYTTSDGGQSWSTIPPGSIDDNFMSNFGWYFGKIMHNPYEPTQIWVLGVRSQRTLDGGQTWENMFDWGTDVHVDHHDMAFLDANTCFIATDGGLYKTTNKGDTWQKAENIPTTQFYRVAWNPHSPEYYYGGAQDNGTLTGNKAGLENWWRVYGGDGFQAAFHPSNPDIHYFEYQNGGIVGTTNGYDYDDATNGIESSDRRSWDAPYMISPNDPSVMLTGTYRLYRSETHLPNWFSVSGDLTDGIDSRYHVISTIDESQLEDNLTYVGTSDGNVWVGNSLSGQFSQINAGLPDRYVSCVKASNSAVNRVFVSVTGYKDNEFSPHLYRSDNKGTNWESISNDLPNFAINDILVLPGHSDSLIFVATDGGVFGTMNGGTHWEKLGTGMPTVPVYDLAINDYDRNLFAGTFARSILSFPLDSLQILGDVSTFVPGTSAVASLNVFPTLATTEINIAIKNLQSDHSTEVFVAGLSGKIMFQTAFSKDKHFAQRIETQDWPDGVYIVFVRTKGKLWAQQKFVVQ